MLAARDLAPLRQMKPAEPTLSLPWPGARPLPDTFFDRDAQLLARELLGKVIRHRVGTLWLSARIIETEAYYLVDKGIFNAPASTEKRKALFADGGHIYMYYARGGDSLNFSAHGPGNAVLIKSAHPWVDAISGPDALAAMQRNNPGSLGQPRAPERLCAGQTLLCKALGRFVDARYARHCTRNPLRRGQVEGHDYQLHTLGPTRP